MGNQIYITPPPPQWGVCKRLLKLNACFFTRNSLDLAWMELEQMDFFSQMCSLLLRENEAKVGLSREKEE